MLSHVLYSAAAGNYGSVYYGSAAGTQCVVKCPNLEPFSLRLFDTEVSFASFFLSLTPVGGAARCSGGLHAR
jgi:hypothetical protein